MAPKKEIVATISLQVPAQKANPAPPIGSALGPKGVNIMDFCKQFNAIKFNYEAGTPIPVTISVYKDKSFTFTTKQPPVTYLIKKAANITKGSSATGKTVCGTIKKSQLEEIAKEKMSDMNSKDLKACYEMIKGSAMSMGLHVEVEA